MSRIKLNESQLRKLIEESVHEVMINEIGDTRRWQYNLGRYAGDNTRSKESRNMAMKYKYGKDNGDDPTGINNPFTNGYNVQQAVGNDKPLHQAFYDTYSNIDTREIREDFHDWILKNYIYDPLVKDAIIKISKEDPDKDKTFDYVLKKFARSDSRKRKISNPTIHKALYEELNNMILDNELGNKWNNKYYRDTFNADSEMHMYNLVTGRLKYE
jgi:hypothetical protein